MRQRSGEFMQSAMDSWGDIVYRVALSQTCSHQDAQDVAQDVFLRLLTSPVEFEDGEHLKAWLLRATINRCCELHRSWWKRRVQGASDAEAFVNASALADSSPTEEAALRAVERHPIWQALRKLPEAARHSYAPLHRGDLVRTDRPHHGMQTRDRADSPQTCSHEAEGIAVSATRQEKGEIMDEKRTVDELRSLMRQVHLPEAVRENVLEAAHPDVAEPTGASTKRRQLITRRSALRLGLAAASVAATFVGLSMHGVPHKGEQAPKEAGSGSFVLVAYAEGTRQDDEVILSVDDFGTKSSSWSEGDEGSLGASRSLSLNCTGNAIKELAYSLEGMFACPPQDSETSQSYVFFDAIAKGPLHEYGGTDADSSCTNFTLAYDQLTQDKESFGRSVRAHFPASAELTFALQFLKQYDPTREDSRSPDEIRAYCEANRTVALYSEKTYAELLSQTPLVITATFEDDSTKTKRYVIAPIADFKRVYGDWLERLTELEVEVELTSSDGQEARDEAETRYLEQLAVQPQLYTIREEA